MSTFDAAAEATATRAVVSHMEDLADAAIARLTDAATKWTISSLTAVANLTLSSLSAAAGTKPALTSLTLPTYTPADFTGIVAPALPATPSLAGATTSMWNEAFWTNLKSKLTAFTDTITGSDDIDSAVNKLTGNLTRMESALFRRGLAHKQQILRDLYSAADASTGAAGFTYPNSMTTALRLDAQQKYQFGLDELSDSIVTNIFEWAKSNYQFSIQQGVAAHGSDIEFNVRYLSVTVEVYTATTNALLKKYEFDISAAVSKSELAVKEFLAEFNGELEKHRTLKEIQLKDAGFDVEVAKVNAAILGEDMKIKLDDFKARVGSFLETAKVNLEDRNENVKNQITASTAAATAALALASGASTITLNTGGG